MTQLNLTSRRWWSQVELRAVRVDGGPRVPSTAAGIMAIARQLGIGGHPLEEVWVAAVDGHYVRSIAMVARGRHHEVHVSLPAVLSVPLLAGTDRLTLIHTHPSAPPVPSSEDVDLTRAVAAAANACGLWLDDHLIVDGDNDVASLRALGWLA